jgi:hypothetical protein
MKHLVNVVLLVLAVAVLTASINFSRIENVQLARPAYAPLQDDTPAPITTDAIGALTVLLACWGIYRANKSGSN